MVGLLIEGPQHNPGTNAQHFKAFNAQRAAWADGIPILMKGD
jgi:hypothetical protein